MTAPKIQMHLAMINQLARMPRGRLIALGFGARKTMRAAQRAATQSYTMALPEVRVARAERP
jgi:hypothetical protein